jgi:hypothetical protein
MLPDSVTTVADVSTIGAGSGVVGFNSLKTQ